MSYSQALEQQLRLYRTWDWARKQRPDIRDRWIDLHLRDGVTYYWSPSICFLISDVAAKLPNNWMFHEDLAPSKSAFWWFANPIVSPSGYQMRAVSWGVTTDEYDGKKILHAEAWHDDDAGGLDISLGTTCLPSGMPLSCARRVHQNEDRKSDIGWLVQSVVAAGLSFIDQRILIAPQYPAERHTRKRLASEGFQHEPLIRVVELRRKQAHPQHHGESEPVEWSHQWIVSGHWRQQWYPSLSANQPRWIMPYVKGPEDKPLKPPRAKVFAVVR